MLFIMLFSTCNYVMNILSTYKSVCYPSVQSLSSVQHFVTPWTIAYQVSCPSQTPRAYSDSCPSVWWCQPTILSSVIPFSSCLHSFQASGSFPMSQFFASGGQSIGGSASILPMTLLLFSSALVFWSSAVLLRIQPSSILSWDQHL